MRFFNTSGPIVPEDHYYVPPLSRLDVDDVLELIDRQRYFVLHAPRQTGKTTALRALRDLLNESDRYRCVYMNVENAQAAREDVSVGIRAILSRLGRETRNTLGERLAYDIWPDVLSREGPESALQEVLVELADADAKPLVLFIDEIDALIGDTLLSVLRQLRSGYPDRPALFPQSVVLCGVRDVRDYRIRAASEPEPVLGGSAFNVKARSLRLGDFSEAEVRALLAQHTEETGQPFAEAALAEVWRLTQGQPWLANALAAEICFEKAGVRDRGRGVDADAVAEARERLILRRDTHLDQLGAVLSERRVQRVVEPLLSGEATEEMFRVDDLQYARDLGLVARSKPLRVANPIYREIIPRELTSMTEEVLVQETAWYVDADGRLSMDKLMAAFQAYFREHSEHWLERFQYREAGPQLLLHAFLHRIANGGGRIEREYGVGRRRMDLAVLWPVRPDGPATAPVGEQRIVVECKVARRGRSVDATLREGLPQTTAYMDLWDATEGHLALFDQTPGRSWRDRLYRREESFAGRAIAVWGM